MAQLDPGSAHEYFDGPDLRLVDHVEILCARAATLAQLAGVLAQEAALLQAAAASMRRQLPRGNGALLHPVPLNVRGALSPRQLEVAALVADGMSNRQVAERLIVTERTVETHLERIFTRLHLQSRAQLARWFVEQDRGTL